METEFGGRDLGRVTMAFCFVDLTGFTRFTEEEGDEEALDLIERFVDSVEATLPGGATLVKTIGDEVMIVSPEPVPLTEWAVGFLGLFQGRPQPRVGIHYGDAVYRDGDYFGTHVNLTHRAVARALGGEVMVTREVAEAASDSEYLHFEPIGAVALKGFPKPMGLCTVRPAHETGEHGIVERVTAEAERKRKTFSLDFAPSWPPRFARAGWSHRRIAWRRARLGRGRLGLCRGRARRDPSGPRQRRRASP